MIEMPPSTGKSVVIALIVGLVECYFNKITILYHDSELMSCETTTIE